MHYILQNVDSTGLVIIDELGRGTSVYEGIGYCFAFAERLLATSAFTFLATHFIPVTNLQALYPNVEKYVSSSLSSATYITHVTWFHMHTNSISTRMHTQCPTATTLR